MDSTTADNGQRGSAIVRAAFHDRSLAAPLPARLAEPVAAIRQAHQRLRFLVVAEAHTAARVARVLGCDGIVADEADTGILAGFVPILVPEYWVFFIIYFDSVPRWAYHTYHRIVNTGTFHLNVRSSCRTTGGHTAHAAEFAPRCVQTICTVRPSTAAHRCEACAPAMSVY